MESNWKGEPQTYPWHAEKIHGPNGSWLWTVTVGERKFEAPVGLQLMGSYFSEADLLGIAHRYQQATDWHLRVPKETPL